MQDAFMQCETLVRAGDKDRFLATLFAPAEHRAAIFAVYAFNLEIARIRELAREPLAGEIRLQWWSDVLSDALGGGSRGEVEGHPRNSGLADLRRSISADLGQARGPSISADLGQARGPVAAALLATIAKYRLEKKLLQALVDARRFDLYDEPMRTLSDFEAYADAASANLIALCTQILDNGREPNIGALAHHAGVAHAVAGLLNAFPVHARRGQLYVPLELLERHGARRQELASGRASLELRAALAQLRLIARRHLGQAGELMRTAPAALMPAFLPVALAPVTLARMEREGYDPFVSVDIAPWRRQWVIWRAGRRPDRIFR
jgi:15-cis-phytoene synthase